MQDSKNVDCSGLAQLSLDLKRLGSTRCQRRDVLLAASGFKASRLMLTDMGIEAVRQLGHTFGFGWAAGRTSFALRLDTGKGGFSNHMTRVTGFDGRREVFLAKNGATASRLLAAHANHTMIGRALRIPTCCTQFYLDKAQAAAKHAYDYSGLIGMPRTHTASVLSNTYCRYFDRGIVDHFPCRHHCRRTREVAKQSAMTLRRVDPSLLTELVAAGTFVYSDRDGVFWLNDIDGVAGKPVIHAQTARESNLARHLARASQVQIVLGSERILRVYGTHDEVHPRSSIFDNVSVVSFRPNYGDEEVLFGDRSGLNNDQFDPMTRPVEGYGN